MLILSVCMWVCKHAWMHVCLLLYEYVCVCVCVCVCVGKAQGGSAKHFLCLSIVWYDVSLYLMPNVILMLGILHGPTHYQLRSNFTFH